MLGSPRSSTLATAVAGAPTQKGATAPVAPVVVLSSRSSGAEPQEEMTPAVELTLEAPIPDSLVGDPRPLEPLVIPAAATPPVLVPGAPLLPSTTPSGRAAFATFGALEEAQSVLDQLQGDQ